MRLWGERGVVNKLFTPLDDWRERRQTDGRLDARCRPVTTLPKRCLIIEREMQAFFVV